MRDERPTIFVVDRDIAVRESLYRQISSSHRAVETYDSAEVFLEGLESRWTGCVVADIDLPGMTGLQLAEHLTERMELIPVIIHSSQNGSATIVRAIKMGAFDFLVRPAELSRLLAVIERAIAEHVRRQRGPRGSLSPRKRQILHCLLEGNTEKQAAEKVGLSHNTVHDYVKQIYQNFGVRSRSELLARCLAGQRRD